MLMTAYLNIRVDGTLKESIPLYSIANSLANAKKEWAENIKKELELRHCSQVAVPEQVKYGWKAELAPYSFNLTEKQPRK